MAVRKKAVVVDIPLVTNSSLESHSLFPKIPAKSSNNPKAAANASKHSHPRYDDQSNWTNGNLNCDLATLTLFDENRERVSFSFLSQRKDLPELHKLLQNAKQAYLNGRRKKGTEVNLGVTGASVNGSPNYYNPTKGEKEPSDLGKAETQKLSVNDIKLPPISSSPPTIGFPDKRRKKRGARQQNTLLPRLENTSWTSNMFNSMNITGSGVANERSKSFMTTSPASTTLLAAGRVGRSKLLSESPPASPSPMQRNYFKFNQGYSLPSNYANSVSTTEDTANVRYNTPSSASVLNDLITLSGRKEIAGLEQRIDE